MLVAPSSVQAQPRNIHRIGYLSGVDAATHSNRFESFRQSLHDLGYTEGKNIIIERRYAEGKLERLAQFSTELVRLNVDIIVSSAPPATRAAKRATATIPIVMAFDDDPVGNGFVASLAQPRGNVTGLSTIAPDIAGKQLEFLKEIVLGLPRVAVLGTSTVPQHRRVMNEITVVATALRIDVLYLDVLSANNIEPQLAAVSKARAAAVIVLGSPFLNSHRKLIVSLVAAKRLPAIYTRPDYVEAGGLMNYGPSFTDLFRRAAVYVDKILKGAKPAELPVEQPTKFELVINLNAAKQIGLSIPPQVLARADRIIR